MLNGDIMGIVENIKKIAVNAVESQKPTTVMFGHAITDDVVSVEGRFDMPRRYLDFMKGKDFQKGDELILLREHGGQRFVVMGVME